MFEFFIIIGGIIVCLIIGSIAIYTGIKDVNEEQNHE